MLHAACEAADIRCYRLQCAHRRPQLPVSVQTPAGGRRHAHSSSQLPFALMQLPSHSDLSPWH